MMIHTRTVHHEVMSVIHKIKISWELLKQISSVMAYQNQHELLHQEIFFILSTD